jgi:3-hydroxybutyrate dehydrogenase
LHITPTLITGINLALATLLLSKGCNVVIADLALLPPAAQLLVTYTATGPNEPTCLYHVTDVTDWSALSSLFNFTLSHFHQIDILVPGAGVFDPPSSNFYNPPGTPHSSDTIEKSTYRTLEVNITHPIRLTQMGVEYWVKEQRPGRVVCLSSIAGQISVMETPLYHASKFAVTGFVRSTKNLQELGIRVVGVAPGVVQVGLGFLFVTAEKCPGGEKEYGENYTR